MDGPEALAHCLQVLRGALRATDSELAPSGRPFPVSGCPSRALVEDGILGPQARHLQLEI